MEVRDTIFDSNSERRVYRSLINTWSGKYAIYPQIPIMKIFHLNKDELELFYRQYFPALQRNYYYQAHADYTICNESGHPLLTVEFDGMNRGLSRNGMYFCPDKCDPQRSIRLNFKLKLASLARYPFIVISDEEVEKIDPDERLMILDGIVGSCIASRESRRKIEKEVNEALANYPDMDNEAIEDLITSIEVETELEHDPIAMIASEFSLRCHEKGIFRCATEYFAEPELPSLTNMFDLAALQKRIDAMKNSTGRGCRISVETPSGIVVQEVLVRNFDTFGVDASTIAENIAKFRAFKNALTLRCT